MVWLVGKIWLFQTRKGGLDVLPNFPFYPQLNPILERKTWNQRQGTFRHPHPPSQCDRILAFGSCFDQFDSRCPCPMVCFIFLTLLWSDIEASLFPFLIFQYLGTEWEGKLSFGILDATMRVLLLRWVPFWFFFFFFPFRNHKWPRFRTFPLHFCLFCSFVCLLLLQIGCCGKKDYEGNEQNPAWPRAWSFCWEGLGVEGKVCPPPFLFSLSL